MFIISSNFNSKHPFPFPSRIVVIQSLRHACLFAARQAPLCCTISQSLLKFMSIELVMLSSHLILCWPLSPFAFNLPPPAPIKVFSNESALPIRGTKYWSFSFSSSPSNEYSGLVSFRIDWLDLLAVQGTFKRLLPLVYWSYIQSLVFMAMILK